MSDAEPQPSFNQKFSQALQSAARLHNLLFSTATFGMLSTMDAGMLIQQGREEVHVISEFFFDAEDELERDGRVVWSIKPDC